MDGDDFTYIRHVDFEKISPGDRYSQKLIDHASGARNAAVAYIRTPPDGGSPHGMHTHPFEQIFYVLEGTMAIEVNGERFTAPAGSLVVFPAGVPHRNWNDTDAPTVHIAINAPAPGPKTTTATTVGETASVGATAAAGEGTEATSSAGPNV